MEISQNISLSLLLNDSSGLNSFDPEKGELHTWLQGIANHAVVKLRQRPENRQVTEEITPESAVCPPVQDGILYDKERKAKLRSAVLKLKLKDQEFFNILVEDELSDAEKARRMGISEAVFRKRKHDLSKKLRRIIEKELAIRMSHRKGSKKYPRKR